MQNIESEKSSKNFSKNRVKIPKSDVLYINKKISVLMLCAKGGFTNGKLNSMFLRKEKGKFKERKFENEAGKQNTTWSFEAEL